MNWIDWFKSYPITTEQRDLYVMLFGFVFVFLFFLGPKKSDYKNYFIAWIVFLVLLGFETGSLWFLFSFRIFPNTFGFISFDQIFWVIIGFICIVATQKLMVAITKRLKIYKDK
jgi:hypothetical protein